MKQSLDILRTRLSKNRRIIALLLTAAFLSSMAGCKKEPPPIRIGTNVWPGYEPLYLAESLGYFDKKLIQLVEFPSSSGVINGIVNHSIDGGALTMDEVLRLADRKIPIRVILILDISNGGDAIVAKEGVDGVKGLKGRRVAVESSALGAYMLHRALSLNGLSMTDVKVRNVEVSEHERVFGGGEIDAVVTFDPVRTALLGAGGHEIFTSREIPGEIVDVLVINEEHLIKDRNTLKMLINGWYRALAYMKSDTADASKRMSHRLQIPAAEVMKSYDSLILPGRDETRELMSKSGNGSSLYAGVDALSRLMSSQGLVGAPISPTSLIDPSFLN